MASRGVAAHGQNTLIVLVIALLALVTSGFGPPTLIESQTAFTPVPPSTLKLMNADRPPRISAKAAVIMDAGTGQVVFEKNSHQRRAMASTTKIMTALVTLEHAGLTDLVTAGPDVKVEPSIIGLDPGDKLTVEQLLYGLLLPSGNDAAIDLADYVGGSVPKFVAMMNAKAAQLGLKDTHYVTPHGLDADGHETSAYDLAVLTRVAMQNPEFEKIVSSKQYQIDGPVRWVFKSLNQLLGTYPGADGVKTGYTDNAGRCLVFSATRDGHRAIAVVLDSADIFGEAAALLNYFFANYGWETLGQAEEGVLGSYSRDGIVHHLVARMHPTVVLPRWQASYLRWTFSISEGAAANGGAEGVASYYLFGKKAADLPLFSQVNY